MDQNRERYSGTQSAQLLISAIVTQIFNKISFISLCENELFWSSKFIVRKMDRSVCDEDLIETYPLLRIFRNTGETLSHQAYIDPWVRSFISPLSNF